MSSPVDVPATYGALLVGGFFAAALSGIVTIQALVYTKLYPIDKFHTKAIVTAVWALDTTHTSIVLTSLWLYLIKNFGNTAEIDRIETPLAVTIQLTAILTFIVHCFYIQRIHKVSHNNWRVSLPIGFFACCRLASATACTAEMIRTGSFRIFKSQFRFLFTLGLALSCFVDVLIAAFLTYTLRNKPKASTSLDHVINTVIVYTLETGSLTGAATVVSMIFWLVMPYNLIFMALHFVISKLYANSLLATLNTRCLLQHERSRGGLSGEPPVPFPAWVNRAQSKFPPPPVDTKVQISVHKTVEYEADGDAKESPESGPASSPSQRHVPSIDLEAAY